MPAERDRGHVSWSRDGDGSSRPADSARSGRFARSRVLARGRSQWSFETFVGLLGLLLFDGLALLVATVAVVRLRLFRGIPCDAYWRDLGGYARTGVWFVVALVVVTVAVAAWRRWHPVAVLIVQLLVAALLLPSMVQTWSDAGDVVAGRRSASEVTTDAGACTPSGG